MDQHGGKAFTVWLWAVKQPLQRKKLSRFTKANRKSGK
jgi:hypothetical protein